jgi:hypothetical protein
MNDSSKPDDLPSRGGPGSGEEDDPSSGGAPQKPESDGD